MQNFKPILTFLFAVIAPLVIITLALREPPTDHELLDQLRETHMHQHKLGVDHSKHAVLQQDFTNPHAITAACLTCHTERGQEVLKNAHWNWEREAFIPGRGVTYLGKKNLINNFCTGIASNEGTCNRCHTGYGWQDESFDFSNEYNIDCLICHDNTNTYEKQKGAAGYPVMGADGPDFRNILGNVGRPGRYNCGYCHFHSAGGNNVKHGDLEMALLTADKTVDVHMGVDGLDMSCVECHPAENHEMLGRYYGVSSSNTQRATCEQCHTAVPHTNSKLNEHTIKVDCRTCHIPTYAKVNPTKTYWDWSTATLRKDGKPYETVDSVGNVSYASIKGHFHWQKMATPEYYWFNGTADHHLISDKIDMDKLPLKINTMFGDYHDKESKIVPMKVHRGKQPYDVENLTIIQPKLWDKDANQGALWIDLDWEQALEKGMEYVGMPYSGKHDFIETEMYLPISHMVSAADQALSCTDCHTRTESRLANLTDFYMPGRDQNSTLDTIGKWLILLSLIGVLLHGGTRVFLYKKNKTAATHK
ncbi:tetrathionate reductase family octaheme c-type cytochrome [Candidatus Falkowbacteria bacterium]|nr:tetrathionate reductase family octaheme c-type cytochrome [Candidatus Falkowbacteria bacterium]